MVHGSPSDGRGPIDVNIIGSKSGSIVVDTDVEIVSISSSIYNQKTALTGSSWGIIMSGTDVSEWTNIAVTVINDGTNTLQSASVEFSPNNSNWETDWDNTTFAGLAANGMLSMQISTNSRRYIRLRAIPSGATGAFTGSTDVYLHTNNG